MTTPSSHMSSSFDPRVTMNPNVGITVNKNGQSLRTNSSNQEAQPIVGSAVATDKANAQTSKDIQQQEEERLLREQQEKNQEDRKDVEDKLAQMEDQPALRKIGIKFVKHEDPECNVVNVVDTNSNETIRQIPSEEFLKMSQRLDEFCDKYVNTDKGADPKVNQSVLIDTKI